MEVTYNTVIVKDCLLNDDNVEILKSSNSSIPFNEGSGKFIISSICNARAKSENVDIKYLQLDRQLHVILSNPQSTEDNLPVKYTSLMYNKLDDGLRIVDSTKIIVTNCKLTNRAYNDIVDMILGYETPDKYVILSYDDCRLLVIKITVFE